MSSESETIGTESTKRDYRASKADITDPRILAIINEIDGGRVLDVGCVQHDPSKHEDPNWLHQHLYDAADELLGVDIDEEGVAALQAAGFNVAISDAEELNLPGQYDYVVAGELIEHLGNPGRFLRAARSRLTEGGKLIITTPNPWSWPRLKQLRSAGEIHCNPEHTHYYDRRTLRQLLERYGFDVRIDFVGPASEGITRRLFHMPVSQLRRLGATQLFAIAEPATSDGNDQG